MEGLSAYKFMIKSTIKLIKLFYNRNLTKSRMQNVKISIRCMFF